MLCCVCGACSGVGVEVIVLGMSGSAMRISENTFILSMDIVSFRLLTSNMKFFGESDSRR